MIQAIYILFNIVFILCRSQVLNIKCDNEEQLAFVRQYKKLPGFEFIKIRSSPTDVDILVLAYQLPNFKEALKSHGIQNKVQIEDFQEYLQVSFEEPDQENFLRKRRSRKYDFSYYPRYEEVKFSIRGQTKLGS